MYCYRPHRLKVVRPVCECKHERKIVERNEEKNRWKKRQQRLKALKKQPIMHIVDTSRPIETIKKFIISDVIEIPHKQNIDIKQHISGVAEVDFISDPRQIHDGAKMISPFQTPEPSKEDISVVPHRHWSPMHIPPGPLPTKNDILKKEMEERKKVLDEALMLIYGDVDKEDAFRPDDDICSKKKFTLNMKEKLWNDRLKEEEEISEDITKITELYSETDKETDSKIKYNELNTQARINNKLNHKDKTHPEKAAEIADYQPDALHKQIIKRTGEKIDDRKYQINEKYDKKCTSYKYSKKSNLAAMVKVSFNQRISLISVSISILKYR